MTGKETGRESTIDLSEAGSWKDPLLEEGQANTWAAAAVPFNSIPILSVETIGWLPVHTAGRGGRASFLFRYLF